MASFTTMDLSEDTGSFQNQPPSAGTPAKRRRRGMTCVLTEANPTAEPARESKRAAKAKIREATLSVKRPRGDSSLGGMKKWAKENTTALPNETQAAEDQKQDVSTLQKLLKRPILKFLSVVVSL